MQSAYQLGSPVRETDMFEILGKDSTLTSL